MKGRVPDCITRDGTLRNGCSLNVGFEAWRSFGEAQIDETNLAQKQNGFVIRRGVIAEALPFIGGAKAGEHLVQVLVQS